MYNRKAQDIGCSTTLRLVFEVVKVVRRKHPKLVEEVGAAKFIT